MKTILERISKYKYLLFGLFCVIAFFILGLYVGYNHQPSINQIALLNKATAVDTTADFEPFWKTWNLINSKYPNANNVSDQERIYGAVAGLVSSLNDPYSAFFDPEETKEFEDEIAGNFSGVGMEVGMKNKIITVIAPLKDSPAEKSGIKSGDKILKINDTITSEMTVETAIRLIRGEKGTQVSLTIFREGVDEPFEVKVTRDIINIPTLDVEKKDNGIFVIRLYSFSANSAKLFRNAIKDLVLSKSDKLIIDLRGNPGGYLEASVDMASWFLPEGKVVVTEDYGTAREAKIYRSKGYNIFNDKLKIVILIDGGSASASEILAGALKDHNKASLVGTRSFGKGSVQEVVDVTKDTILKITVAKWLTPNGNTIAEKGLTPDYIVPVNINTKGDPQMDKAVEVLLNN